MLAVAGLLEGIAWKVVCVDSTRLRHRAAALCVARHFTPHEGVRIVAEGGSAGKAGCRRQSAARSPPRE